MMQARNEDDRHEVRKTGTPVVVTGADLPEGLGVARALRNLGVPVFGLALNPSSPCCRSSAWADVSPVFDDSERGWMEALLKHSARHPGHVLIPAQDTLVDVVARNSEVLEEHYSFVLPDYETVQMLADKTAFAPWAEANGFPVPQTHIVSSVAELDAALRLVSFPIVLKPFTRNRKWHEASGRDKVYRLDSAAAVARIPFRLFDVSDRYVVQEWIDGSDSDVFFCLVYRDRSGRELGHQSGRKLLQWPVGTGSTALCTTVEDHALHHLTGQVFDRIGLVGLGSLEVKRSRRDGKFYITEPTVGRNNLQSNVATAAGRNLAAVAYRDACRLPAVPMPGHRNAIWFNESFLPPALVVAAGRRELNLTQIGRALLRSRGVRSAYSARGDLRPLGRLLAGKLRTTVGLVMRRGGGHPPR